jgi:hypothetical protein
MVRIVLPTLLLAQLGLCSDFAASVRDAEQALVVAINSHDRDAIASLVAPVFHVSWSFGSALRSTRTESSRQEWLDGVEYFQTGSYAVTIESVRSGQAQTKSREYSSAFVSLSEHWTVQSPREGRIEKRFKTVDLWTRQHDGWKLSSRVSQSELR